MPGEDLSLTLTEHLDDLRTRIIRALVGWLVLTAAAWSVSDRLLQFLIRPPIERLVFLSPVEPFFALIKVSLAAGFIAAFPWVAYQAWAFVSPGLKPAERKWFVILIGPSYMLFLGGCALGETKAQACTGSRSSAC